MYCAFFTPKRWPDCSFDQVDSLLTWTWFIDLKVGNPVISTATIPYEFPTVSARRNITSLKLIHRFCHAGSSVEVPSVFAPFHISSSKARGGLGRACSITLFILFPSTCGKNGCQNALTKIDNGSEGGSCYINFLYCPTYVFIFNEDCKLIKNILLYLSV